MALTGGQIFAIAVSIVLIALIIIIFIYVTGSTASTNSSLAATAAQNTPSTLISGANNQDNGDLNVGTMRPVQISAADIRNLCAMDRCDPDTDKCHLRSGMCDCKDCSDKSRSENTDSSSGTLVDVGAYVDHHNTGPEYTGIRLESDQPVVIDTKNKSLSKPASMATISQTSKPESTESSCTEESSCGMYNKCVQECKENNLISNPRDYFTALDISVVEFCNLEPSDIADITDNGKTVYALKKSDSTKIVMRTRDGGECEITSKQSLSCILFFNGDMYGLSGGRLYRVDPKSVGRRVWYWFLPETFPSDIIWITTTTNRDWLWIQTSDTGYLYSSRGNKICLVRKVESLTSNATRIFGTTPKHAAQVDTATHQLTLLQCEKTFQNVGAAIFNNENGIVYIRPSQLSIVSGIRLILGCPYYLLT